MVKHINQKEQKILTAHKKRRKFGQHFTSKDIFEVYIRPHLEEKLDDYIFVDLFSGSGNLILPILDLIPEDKKINYFEKHLYLFDVQKKWVQNTRKNAMDLGIPKKIAEKNIIQRDTLDDYPDAILSNLDKPIFHITNPPYLYLGYIAKHEETKKYLKLFEGENDGYQDLYQIALMNDLRHSVQNMIYILPSNFIFGKSVSNKIRIDFLKHYDIDLAYIFEKKIFENTGTNVMITFFSHKKNFGGQNAENGKNEKEEKDGHKPITFWGTKFKKQDDKIIEKQYTLLPQHKYKAGSEFLEFVEDYTQKHPLKIKYYLKAQEVEDNPGKNTIKVIDSNNYQNNQYQIETIQVNKKLLQKIEQNPLWIRTVDTGKWEGRAGLYSIRDFFGVSGILVSGNTYRTNPIQVFTTPWLNNKECTIFRQYFNLVLEWLREKSDSEFMTTYKYSNGPYTRKYFGLSQARKLAKTFPIEYLREKPHKKDRIMEILKKEEIKDLIRLLKDSQIKNPHIVEIRLDQMKGITRDEKIN